MNISGKGDWQIWKEKENFTRLESWNKESGFICNARKLHREGERSLKAVTEKGPAWQFLCLRLPPKQLEVQAYGF